MVKKITNLYYTATVLVLLLRSTHCQEAAPARDHWWDRMTNVSGQAAVYDTYLWLLFWNWD